MNGAEKLQRYIRCMLDAKERQPLCRWFARGQDGWCVHNDHGWTDECSCTDAKRECSEEATR